MKPPALLTSRPLGWSLIGHLSSVGLLAIVAATTMNVLIGYLAIIFLDISKTFFVLIGYLALTALGIFGLFLPLSWYGTTVPFTVVVWPERRRYTPSSYATLRLRLGSFPGLPV